MPTLYVKISLKKCQYPGDSPSGTPCLDPASPEYNTYIEENSEVSIIFKDIYTDVNDAEDTVKFFTNDRYYFTLN